MTTSQPNDESIFHAARGIADLDRRRQYVREVCREDEARVAHIEAMLAAADAPDSLLDRPAWKDAKVTFAPPELESPGTSIGPYKLIEQIGEGGMGTVWMAQQTEPVKRLVAVKLIKAGMDSKQVIARFEAERQALALMDHANIARVLDAGMTAAGRPYFVMDLVKGVPITKYCDEHRLTPRQRLELFIPVCQAVQHAHQKGIIHRDLKPSNVLIALYDGKPVPKIIDFGVAKAAGQQLTDKTLVTGFGAIVGTPEYMSPEQAEINQLDIDTRSDVYSLGVLLYELLAGSPPFNHQELQKAGMLEMLRVIREQEPSKPSTKLSTAEGLPTLAANRGTEPAKLTKLVRGELDWIVMKALEKDRNRRYETANAFALDIERYLNDDQVVACPPSAGYRLRKFARRNKGAVFIAASLLFFFAVLGSGFGWVVRDRRAREQALDDEVNRAISEAESLIRKLHWSEASAMVERIEALWAASARRENVPRLEDLKTDLAMVRRLEEIYEDPNRGEFLVGPDVETQYTEAFRQYGIDVAALPASDAAARIRATNIPGQLVKSLDFWALMRKFADDHKPRDWQYLLELAERVDDDHQRNVVRAAVRNDDHQSLERLAASHIDDLPPETLTLLGRSLLRTPERAEPFLRAAQRRYPNDMWINDTLGLICFWSHPPKFADAVRCYSVVVALRPKNPYKKFQLAETLRRQGSVAESIAMFSEAIDSKPDYWDAWWRQGFAYLTRGDTKHGLANFNHVIRENPADANAWSMRAFAYSDIKQWDKAIADCSKAIELDPRNANAHKALAITLGLRRPGKENESIALLRKLLHLDPNSVWAYCGLGTDLHRQGKFDEASVAFRRAIERDDDCVWAQCGLGSAELAKGHVDQAVTAFREAIRLDPGNVWAHCGLGEALLHNGSLNDAVAVDRKAIELDPKSTRAHFALASALFHQGELKAAIAQYCTAFAIKLTELSGGL